MYLLTPGCPACNVERARLIKQALFNYDSADRLTEAMSSLADTFKRMGEAMREFMPKGHYTKTRNAGCLNRPAQGKWRDILPRHVWRER